MDKKYTNKELAQAYYLVVAQGSSKTKFEQYIKDEWNISVTEENIQTYFEKYGNLDNLEIRRIGKKNKIGKMKRKLLEKILTEGFEKVRDKIREQRISFDFTRRTNWQSKPF